MHVRRTANISICVTVLLLVGAASAWGQGLVISEFMASNPGFLTDTDSDSPDWIEIFNGSSAPVNLDGWSLSDNADNARKWIFPPFELAPGEFLVVFASGKDRRDPLGEMHTNFQLDDQGEFLGLFNPDEDPVSFYNPEYPPQVPHASYGLVMETAATTMLSAGANARYLVPENNDLELTWVAPEFNDEAWAQGATGFGFDSREEPDGPHFLDLIQTNVGALMEDINSSIYIRIPFEVPAGEVPSNLVLRAKYDDGFAAFINGVEVARRHIDARPEAPTALRYNSRAIREREDEDAMAFEAIPVPAGGLLQPGTNVLAIQAMTRSRRSSPDFLMVPELDALSVESVETNNAKYFAEPTPVWPNGAPSAGVAATPDFTLPSMAFIDPITVEIPTADPAAQVRYTLDGFEPTEESPVYSEPILLEATTTIKARSFQADHVPSLTITRTYLRIASNLETFSSNIPLVVCSTIGQPIGNNCGGGNYTKGQMAIFTPGQDGRTRFTNAPHYADIAAFRKRGSSTCSRPKFSFNVELKESFDPETSADLRPPDPLGAVKNASIFGLPEDGDWIMYGPYNFDRALMRNPLAYWMSREVGRWAARSRFVECYFVNNSATRTNPVSTAHYMGVYVFMEKNKRHPERVPLEGLSSLITEEPELRGGYMLRRDRVGSGEVSTSAGGYGSLVFVYPKQPSGPQRTYITQYINQAIGSLNPNIGSQADSNLIDVGEFLDHHILNWYPKNVDAFRLSGYFHKKRNGLLAMGPVWDYDRTMGCADDARANNPEGWDNTSSGDGGTRYFQAGGLGSWYSILFQNAPPTGNSPWARAYRARWRELRDGPLATDNILGQIDAWAAELNEAAARNFNKWTGTRPRGGTFQAEVNTLKNWLSLRAAWIDSQFIATPEFSPPESEELVPVGLPVEITAEQGQVYYTINGPDPMGAGSAPAPEALAYTEPVQVTGNMRIRARALIGERTWSKMVEAIYVTERLPIVVTEIMYHSPEFPDDQQSSTRYYDFFELKNIGDEPISLADLSTAPRPVLDTSGGTVTTLGPGEYAVAVGDIPSFRARYGNNIPIAGEYEGSLGNTRGSFQILGPIGETILAVAYDDDWFPSTDGNQDGTPGEGRSLVIIDPEGPPEKWTEADGWRASHQVGGSPGMADSIGGFQRQGDYTQDMRLGVSDAVNLLLYLHAGAEPPCQTPDGNAMVLDVNGDTQVDGSDAIFLLGYIFQKGPPPSQGVECILVPGCPDSCQGGR